MSFGTKANELCGPLDCVFSSIDLPPSVSSAYNIMCPAGCNKTGILLSADRHCNVCQRRHCHIIIMMMMIIIIIIIVRLAPIHKFSV